MKFERISSVTGLLDDELATANRLLTQLDERAGRNLMRSSIYDGKRAIRQVGTIIPPQYYRLGHVLGWCAKGVDSLVRRTTLERFTWADGDLDSLGARELWDSNYLRSEVNSALVSSVLHGVSFLVTVQGEKDEPDALILSRDALNSTGTWNPRTRSLDDFVSVTKREDDRPVEFTLYLFNLTISVAKMAGGWRVVERSDHPWGVPAQPLTYRPRVGRAFGSSRITRPAIAAQDAGVRDLIRLEGHMDIYSYPELILLGADGSVFKDEDGNTLPAWEARIGRIKGIPDDEDADTPRAEVKSIPASSPAPHLSALSTHAKVCARELSLPDSALALTDIANPTSAEAYDASQYELIADARGAIDDWSTPLRKIHATALAIQNGLDEVPSEWLGIDSKWRNPQFLTQSAEADAGAKRLAAVPWLSETEVGLELLGLNDDQIRRAQADKRRAQGMQTLAGLTAAADAARQDPAVAAAGEDGEDAKAMKAKFDALGVAIRAGVDPEDAARRLGLDGIGFTGAIPVSLRVPENKSGSLEDK